MILRYSREMENEKSEKGPYLTLGMDYICLGIIFYGNTSISPQAIVPSNHNEKPYSFDLSCFDFVDSRIPEGWSFSGDERGFCELFPNEISPDFLDSVEAGHEVYNIILSAVIRKIKRFHDIEDEGIINPKINNFPDKVL